MNKDLTYDFFHKLAANNFKVYLTMEGETSGKLYTIVAFDELSLFATDGNGCECWLNRAHIVKIELIPPSKAEDQLKKRSLDDDLGDWLVVR